MFKVEVSAIVILPIQHDIAHIIVDTQAEYQSLNHKKTPYTSPWWVSYGVFC